jgi:phage gpG-like protein
VAQQFLRVKIFGVTEAEHMFERGAIRASHMRPVMEDIADDMMSVFGRVFDSQGRRGGGSWAGLKPDTIRQKVKAHEPLWILIQTGALRASVTERDAPFQMLRVTNNSINIGSYLPYARAHQEGNEHVPARPYLRFTHYDAERWAGMCTTAIVRAMKIGTR